MPLPGPIEPELNVAIPVNVPYTFTFDQEIAANTFEHNYGAALLIALFGSVGGVKPITFTQSMVFPIMGMPPGLSISSGGVLSGTPTTPGQYYLFCLLLSAPATNPPPPALSLFQYIAAIYVQPNVSAARYRPIFG